MSHSIKTSKQESQELTVYGWIRQNCTHFQMPIDLQKLCILMYMIIMDSWDAANIDKDKFEINEETNTVTIKHHDWSHAFGTDIIKKGMCMSWKFKLDDDPSKSSLAILIGIIPRKKVSKSLKPHFIDSKCGGYAFYTHLADIKHNGWKFDNEIKSYGQKCVKGDTVKMILDLTQKENKNGSLSYEINDKQYGIAFDDIDIEKEYCMTVEMVWHGQSIQIIE